MNQKIILGSKSPRRRALLQQTGLEFELRVNPVVERYSKELKREEIPVYLCELKAEPFIGKLKSNEIVITADTIVWKDDTVYEKPKDKKDAFRILTELSNASHEVISAVCLATNEKKITFYETTTVYFKDLAERDIRTYIDNYETTDKAGAYGIQEWIGLIGIDKIEGCYYNVVGLPVARLIAELKANFDFRLG